MKYIHLLSLEALPDEPVIIVSEFDDEPFVVVEITREDFENHWALALKSRN